MQNIVKNIQKSQRTIIIELCSKVHYLKIFLYGDPLPQMQTCTHNIIILNQKQLLLIIFQ